MRTFLLIISFCFSIVTFSQMEIGSVWKLTGNAANFLEQNGIDSTKIHFLASGVFLITYENNGNAYTETSTWTEPSNGSILFTYDPSGFFFGTNCPTENTTFDYTVVSNAFTMENVSGTCSIATGLLANSTWEKQGTASVMEYGNAIFSAYPNPTNATLFFSCSTAIDVAHVSVCNVLGQKQNVSPSMLTGSLISFDVSGWSAGVYFIDYNAQFKMRFEVR